MSVSRSCSSAELVRRHRNTPSCGTGWALPSDSLWQESSEASVGVSDVDASTAAASLLPHHDWGNLVHCESCGQKVEHVRCRVLSKLSGGRWRCPACNVTCTQLRRVHGEWPSSAFSRLSPDCIKQLPTVRCAPVCHQRHSRQRGSIAGSGSLLGESSRQRAAQSPEPSGCPLHGGGAV